MWTRQNIIHGCVVKFLHLLFIPPSLFHFRHEQGAELFLCLLLPPTRHNAAIFLCLLPSHFFQ
jgi:hypothetical protein